MTATRPITTRHGACCAARPARYRDYVAEARAAGAQTAILSSEELDYVLHVPQKALAMEAEARDAGVTDVIWAARAAPPVGGRSGPISRS